MKRTDDALAVCLVVALIVGGYEYRRFARARGEACRLRWHQVAVIGDSVYTAERCGAAPASRP